MTFPCAVSPAWLSSNFLLPSPGATQRCTCWCSAKRIQRQPALRAKGLSARHLWREEKSRSKAGTFEIGYGGGDT
ncbi:hypothetical protein LENED_001299 [Lentinula edodes]|uniref:Uncharacterized protein n=1 Tax=Lentinula edodes TaxID=5353 RepID=A0A1Q3DXR8_LENED|nr:hypothetical protein LENED_001299 [Lentinula edodes]